jgi:hypothetical protein
MRENVRATIVRNECDFGGHSHVASEGDQVRMGAKAGDICESAIIAHGASGSAKTPNA